MEEMKQGVAAVEHRDCTAPTTCLKQHPGRCVTPKGKETTPHAERWKAGEHYADGYNSLVPLVNDLTVQRDQALALVPSLRTSLDAITAQLATTKATLATALADESADEVTIAGLRAQVTQLQAWKDAHPDTLAIPGYDILFSDDFTAIDPNRWLMLDGLNMGGHAETAKAKNISVVGGKVRMAVVREPVTASNGTKTDYSGAFMYTQGKFALPANDWVVECVASVPWGQGLWPAPCWFRPYPQWGAAEMDLVECIGRELAADGKTATMHFTLHAGTSYSGTAHKSKGFSVTISDPLGFHTYRVEKKSGVVRMWVDGKLAATWTRGVELDAATWDAAYESGRQWAIWSNYQLGGSWAGAVDPNLDMSGEKTAMYIDRITAWTKAA